MTEAPSRRRAPGMSPDQRRDMVVRAALPLIAEYGAAVTTAQIARAAGIGEATIFRVFADKDAVLDACVAAALDPGTVLQELNTIDVEQPLANRLLEAADALDAYLGRMGAVLGALHASGLPNRRGQRDRSTPDRPVERSTGRDSAQAATRQAIAELFEPDRDLLRLPVDVLTDAYLRLLFGRTTRPGEQVAEHDQRQLIDLLLHGAVRPQDRQ
ncbi:AcrR family transcriptional regulator [Micromonospora luteifusca]|uniref:AcrR family transcriptional regulator n=1 Tax=Micromonospora luteifusca TaxID=709860 RepID=A0ABS2M1Y7_9ACTN|nr:TetR/AcrR family transcriptional regulator [Micromonospora luteifusca]MBM7494432.1 AcrR family transcriptional regulator [Micromonospora luteifusca]